MGLNTLALWINERQNSMLLTTLKVRRSPGRVTQGLYHGAEYSKLEL